ncbi:unnamed protein product [Amoebophrya sp. A120]|nr:unnamed protein product [Amoebophrya sp. A120]|eukprot:GSA120T00006898001.1
MKIIPDQQQTKVVVTHVQSISSWAMACIGPYGQASQTKSALWDGEKEELEKNHTQYFFSAGVLGLVPHLMEFPRWHDRFVVPEAERMIKDFIFRAGRGVGKTKRKNNAEDRGAAGVVEEVGRAQKELIQLQDELCTPSSASSSCSPTSSTGSSCTSEVEKKNQLQEVLASGEGKKAPTSSSSTLELTPSTGTDDSTAGNSPSKDGTTTSSSEAVLAVGTSVVGDSSTCETACASSTEDEEETAKKTATEERNRPNYNRNHVKTDEDDQAASTDETSEVVGQKRSSTSCSAVQGKNFSETDDEDGTDSEEEDKEDSARNINNSETAPTSVYTSGTTKAAKRKSIKGYDSAKKKKLTKILQKQNSESTSFPGCSPYYQPENCSWFQELAYAMYSLFQIMKQDTHKIETVDIVNVFVSEEIFQADVHELSQASGGGNANHGFDMNCGGVGSSQKSQHQQQQLQRSTTSSVFSAASSSPGAPSTTSPNSPSPTSRNNMKNKYLSPEAEELQAFIFPLIERMVLAFFATYLKQEKREENKVTDLGMDDYWKYREMWLAAQPTEDLHQVDQQDEMLLHQQGGNGNWTKEQHGGNNHNGRRKVDFSDFAAFCDENADGTSCCTARTRDNSSSMTGDGDYTATTSPAEMNKKILNEPLATIDNLPTVLIQFVPGLPKNAAIEVNVLKGSSPACSNGTCGRKKKDSFSTWTTSSDSESDKMNTLAPSPPQLEEVDSTNKELSYSRPTSCSKVPDRGENRCRGRNYSDVTTSLLDHGIEMNKPLIMQEVRPLLTYKPDPRYIQACHPRFEKVMRQYDMLAPGTKNDKNADFDFGNSQHSTSNPKLVVDNPNYHQEMDSKSVVMQESEPGGLVWSIPASPESLLIPRGRTSSGGTTPRMSTTTCNYAESRTRRNDKEDLLQLRSRSTAIRTNFSLLKRSSEADGDNVQHLTNDRIRSRAAQLTAKIQLRKKLQHKSQHPHFLLAESEYDGVAAASSGVGEAKRGYERMKINAGEDPTTAGNDENSSSSSSTSSDNCTNKPKSSNKHLPRKLRSLLESFTKPRLHMYGFPAKTTTKNVLMNGENALRDDKYSDAKHQATQHQDDEEKSHQNSQTINRGANSSFQVFFLLFGQSVSDDSLLSLNKVVLDQDDHEKRRGGLLREDDVLAEEDDNIFRTSRSRSAIRRPRRHFSTETSTRSRGSTSVRSGRCASATGGGGTRRRGNDPRYDQLQRRESSRRTSCRRSLQEKLYADRKDESTTFTESRLLAQEHEKQENQQEQEGALSQLATIRDFFQNRVAERNEKQFSLFQITYNWKYTTPKKLSKLLLGHEDDNQFICSSSAKGAFSGGTRQNSSNFNTTMVNNNSYSTQHGNDQVQQGRNISGPQADTESVNQDPAVWYSPSSNLGFLSVADDAYYHREQEARRAGPGEDCRREVGPLERSPIVARIVAWQ